MSGPAWRVLVVGGGIAGLAAAASAADEGADVTVREAADRLGGKIRTTPFAGLPAVDEAADAFLTRTPEAVRLAERLGLAGSLTSPTQAAPAVWYGGLHALPDGLVLGVPATLGPFLRTGLLTWRGKARAAFEPFLPRTSTSDDSIGAYVRGRFGDEVHERLVDSLVGSIYAADTDRFSLQAVPQLAALAGRERSMLVGARRTRSRAGAPSGPLFAAPVGGMGALVEATAGAVLGAGGEIHTGSPVQCLEPDGSRWRVDGEPFDAVILASPAGAAAPLLRSAAPDAARLLSRSEHADVIIVTMAVAAGQWPAQLAGCSGYLVPKPVQRTVTAVSFGSQKWAHWRPDDGAQLLRVSLGRDGSPVEHLDDQAAVTAAVTEVAAHLGFELSPSETRVSRWPGAFPQYRPHHADWVTAVRAALPPGLVVAGASYDGIGIPACVRQAETAARQVTRMAGVVR